MRETEQSQPASEPLEPPAKLRLDYLDGLRGLAALLVVIDHTWQGFGRAARPGPKGWLTNWALYGHLSVDVFIVISGFCLVLPVAASKTIQGGAAAFFKRRARRILPPVYFALVLSLPINFAVHKIGHHPLVTPKALLANIFLLQDWLPGLDVLDGPLWSVAAEWKIYFLFPFLIWIWKRFNTIWMLAAAALIGYSITGLALLVHSPASLGNTCPWYVFLFAMGICAGVATARSSPTKADRTPLLQSLAVVSLTALGVLLAKYPVPLPGKSDLNTPHLPLIDPVAGILTAVCLLLLHRGLGAQKTGGPLRMLSWPPLVKLGTFAYSIYLIHIPLLGLIAGGLHRIGLTNYRPIPLALVLFFIVIPVVIIIAYLFFILCERPFLNTRRHKIAAETERDAALSPAP